MIKAVIFDLDGVLVSTDELHYKAWQRLASELGIDSFTKEDNVRQRGVSRMESLEIVLEKSGKEFSEEEKIELASRKNEYYVKSLESLNLSSVLPGTFQTLSTLKEKNIPTAIGSASKNTPLILAKTGIAQYFDAVADGHDTTRSKPDPQVFQIAAGKLNINPELCLVVEDADAGIQAGHIAGMKTFGVGPAAKNPLADYSAENLADLCINWDDILN